MCNPAIPKELPASCRTNYDTLQQPPEGIYDTFRAGYAEL